MFLFFLMISVQLFALEAFISSKMVKMDLKFIKTSNRSSFLSMKLLFSGFQISFPMFLKFTLQKHFLPQLQSRFNVFMSGM
jgi:hypothetical protein